MLANIHNFFLSIKKNFFIERILEKHNDIEKQDNIDETGG
jgi:hypothetical protein